MTTTTTTATTTTKSLELGAETGLPSYTTPDHVLEAWAEHQCLRARDGLLMIVASPSSGQGYVDADVAYGDARIVARPSGVWTRRLKALLEDLRSDECWGSGSQTAAEVGVEYRIVSASLESVCDESYLHAGAKDTQIALTLALAAQLEQQLADRPYDEDDTYEDVLESLSFSTPASLGAEALLEPEYKEWLIDRIEFAMG